MRNFNLDALVILETFLPPDQHTVPRDLSLKVDIRRTLHPSHRNNRGYGGIAVVTKNSISVTVKEVDPENNWVWMIIDSINVIAAYLSPSMTMEEVDSTFRTFDRLQHLMIGPCCLVGDFNCRAQSLGDSCYNLRGRWLEEALPRMKWNRIAPEDESLGKWTTQTWRGQGITDLVFDLKDRPTVEGLRIWEQESVGGSDHRLLTFHLQHPHMSRPPPTLRWRSHLFSRKDAFAVKVTDKYIDLIEDTAHLLTLLRSIQAQVDSWITQKTRVPLDARQQKIDELWLTIKAHITAALEGSCKRNSTELYTDNLHYSQEMRDLQSRIDEAQQTATLATRSLPQGHTDIKRAWRLYGDLRKQFKKRMIRKQRISEARKSDISEKRDTGSFLHEVKLQLQQTLRPSQAALSPEDMHKHVAHFETTFGAPPCGDSSVFDESLLRTSDPSNSIVLSKYGGISLKETLHAMAKVPFKKSPGVDGFAAEVWRTDTDTIAPILRGLFQFCDHLLVIPKEWSTCKIIPVFKKKGNPKEISNYRPIALTCAVRRMFEKVIEKKYLKKIPKRLTHHQGGFRQHRGTFDQITRLYEHLTAAPEATVVFLDMKSAYDCVDRRILWTRLAGHFRIPVHVIALLRVLFDFNVSFLWINGYPSPLINNLRGLLQGSSLSPLLFNTFIDALSIMLTKCPGGLRSQLRELLNHLMYADDTTIFDTGEYIQMLLDVATTWAFLYGMRFNGDKCKAIRKGPPLSFPLRLQQGDIDVVDHHPYLGLIFSARGVDWSASMTPRLKKATMTMNILTTKGLHAFGWSFQHSIVVYKTFIRPLFEYGLALTLLPKPVIACLQKCQNEALRRILSTAHDTSIPAMHAFLNVDYMEFRNHLLQMKYYYSVLRMKRRKHPIGDLTFASLAGYRSLSKESWIRIMAKRNMWRQHLTSSTLPILSSSIIDERLSFFRKRCVRSSVLVSWPLTNVGAGKPHPLVKCTLLRDRISSYAISQFLFGQCGQGWRSCHQCDSDLSRSHFLDCGGMVPLISSLAAMYSIHSVSPLADLLLLLHSDALFERHPKCRAGNTRVLATIGIALQTCRVKTMNWIRPVS